MVHRVIQELEIRKELGIPIQTLIFSGAQRFYYRRKDAPRIRALVESFDYSLEGNPMRNAGLAVVTQRGRK